MCCARGGKVRCQWIWGESARGGGTDAQHQAGLEGVDDARTGMPHGIPRGAMCVQRFDDSLNSAIHTTYRISLRSSSMPEPRDPLLKVVTIVCLSEQVMLDARKRVIDGSDGRLPRRRRTRGTGKVKGFSHACVKRSYSFDALTTRGWLPRNRSPT
jgi:hypothetical protein